MGILNQGPSLKNVHEVVLADDCSPDRTEAVAKKIWKASTPPLRTFRNSKNTKEYINVNTCIASLPENVEWFLHMHGDNVPLPNWLESFQKACLKADDKVGMVCASYEVFEGNKNLNVGDKRGGQERIIGGDESVRGTILKGCWWHTSCTAIRKKTFLEVGGFPPGMRQKGDWDYLLRFLSSGSDIIYLQKPLMRYRMHEASASSFALGANLDIEESLQIVLKFAGIMRAHEILLYHYRTAVTLLRRNLSAIIKINPKKAYSSALYQIRNCANCISCLIVKFK